MNLYQKLVEVQKAVSFLKKDNQGYQFKFVSSADTLAPIRCAMDEQGVLLMVKITGHALSEKETKGDGRQLLTELDIVFTWVNADKPDEREEFPFYAQGLDTGEKGVGKCLTYAEKYFLLKFFHIATDKDDPDTHQGNGKQTRPPAQKREPAPQKPPAEPQAARAGAPAGETGEAATEAQCRALHSIAKAKRFTDEQLYGIIEEQTGRRVQSTADLTKSQASTVIKSLQGDAAEIHKGGA